MAEWDWADTVKGIIATALGAAVTLAYKRFKPTYLLIKKYLNIVIRTEKIAEKVSVIESRQYALFHVAENPTFISNTKGEVTYVNPAWLEMTGFENQNEALNFGYMSAIHPEDRAELEHRRDEMTNHPVSFFGAVRFKNKKTGNIINTICRTKLIYNEKKELVETVGRLYIVEAKTNSDVKSKIRDKPTE